MSAPPMFLCHDVENLAALVRSTSFLNKRAAGRASVAALTRSLHTMPASVRRAPSSTGPMGPLA